MKKLLLIPVLACGCFSERELAPEPIAHHHQEIIVSTTQTCSKLLTECEDWEPRLVESASAAEMRKVLDCAVFEGYEAKHNCYEAKSQIPQLNPSLCERKFTACIQFLEHVVEPAHINYEVSLHGYQP